MKKIIKKKWKLLVLLILGVFLILLNYKYISFTSNDFIFYDSNTIPKSKFALFLGTPKYLASGNINNYYKNRINTTIQLYSKGIINTIIISADSLNKYNENEVVLIKSDLIERGIKESDLLLDKNGNRTWKSINNLKLHNNINEVIIISQKFHLERALYIAKKMNIQAIGFVAKGNMSNKLWFREILARVKMQIDIITDK